MVNLLERIGTSDTPVWMLWKDRNSSNYNQYKPVLVAWYNVHIYSDWDFLTLKTFGSESEAGDYLKEFWQAYWRLGL
jgi:hypothetical protein